MAKGDPITSPFALYEAADYQGRVIRITIVFDNVTRLLSSATVHRDVGCLYTKITFGLGADGTPDTSTKTVSVPVGDTAATKAQLNAIGLNTAEDCLLLQITAVR